MTNASTEGHVSFHILLCKKKLGGSKEHYTLVIPLLLRLLAQDQPLQVQSRGV